MGANAVSIGRPYVYGLALGGSDGVEAVLRSLLGELDVTMGLSGYNTVDALRGSARDSLMHESDIIARTKMH